MKILRFEQFTKQETTEVNESLALLVPIGILWFFFIFMTGLSPTANFIDFIKDRKTFKRYMNQLREVLKPYAKKLEKNEVLSKILKIKRVKLTKNEMQSIVDADVAEQLKSIMSKRDYDKFFDIVRAFKIEYNIKDSFDIQISQQDANKLNKCMNSIRNTDDYDDYYDDDDYDGEDTISRYLEHKFDEDEFGEDEEEVGNSRWAGRTNDEDDDDEGYV